VDWRISDEAKHTQAGGRVCVGGLVRITSFGPCTVACELGELLHAERIGAQLPVACFAQTDENGASCAFQPLLRAVRRSAMYRTKDTALMTDKGVILGIYPTTERMASRCFRMSWPKMRAVPFERIEA
jgi:hypothetical protein